MGNYIDLNQERAKRFFLNMLEEDGSKTMWDFRESLIEQLVKEPLYVFMAIDALWDCHEKVPNWFCQIWHYNYTESSLLLDVSNYSGLMRGIKEEVEELLFDDIAVCGLPDYCKYKNRSNCWICKHAKDYKDCKTNNLPELFSKQKEYEKWEPKTMEEIDGLGISIGIADGGTVIECVYCKTRWDKFSDWFRMVNLNNYPNSPEDQERFEILKKWRADQDAVWYVCPFRCRFNNLEIRGEQEIADIKKQEDCYRDI